MQFVPQSEPSRLSTGTKDGLASTKKESRPVFGEISNNTPLRSDLTSTETLKSAKPSTTKDQVSDRRFSQQSTGPSHVKTRQSFDKENMSQNYEFVQPVEAKRLSTASQRETEWTDNRNLDYEFKRKSVAPNTSRDSFLKSSETRFSDSQVLSSTLQSSEGLTQRTRTSLAGDAKRLSGEGVGSQRQSLGGESIAEEEEVELTGAKRILKYFSRKTLAIAAVVFSLIFVVFLASSVFAARGETDVFVKNDTGFKISEDVWEPVRTTGAFEETYETTLTGSSETSATLSGSQE